MNISYNIYFVAAASLSNFASPSSHIPPGIAGLPEFASLCQQPTNKAATQRLCCMLNICLCLNQKKNVKCSSKTATKYASFRFFDAPAVNPDAELQK